MTTPNFKFVITYAGKDITRDISPMIHRLEYKDNVSGSADTIEIVLDDTNGLWTSIWYPVKGDSIRLEIGYDQLLNCGTFEVDETSFSINPDLFTIRAIAAPISKSIRTKATTAFENQSLAQIVQKIASKNGLSLTGTISNIIIARINQLRETDLGFLSRLAETYGHVFSLRDKKIFFSDVYELESINAVDSVSREQLASLSVTDKIVHIYKKSRVRHHDPRSGKFISATNAGEDESNDDLEVWVRAETTNQAEAISKAKLHKLNSIKTDGSFSVFGNPYVLAGNNIEIIGIGKLSGIYHILSSTHSISGDKYMTSAEVKKVGEVPAAKQKPNLNRNKTDFL